MPLLNGASRSGTPSDHQGWRIRKKTHREIPVCFTQFKGKAMLDYAAKLTQEFRKMWRMMWKHWRRRDSLMWASFMWTRWQDIMPTSTVWRMDLEWNWKASEITRNRFCDKSLSGKILQVRSFEIFSLFNIYFLLAALWSQAWLSFLSSSFPIRIYVSEDHWIEHHNRWWVRDNYQSPDWLLWVHSEWNEEVSSYSDQLGIFKV